MGSGRDRALLAAAALAPLAVFAAVLASPRLDGDWENHPAHFWLVLSAAAGSVVLASAVGAAARRRRDARLSLIALAFLASAGFLGLHALATPGVLVGPNGGFELATPVGLLVAGAFAAASGVELSRPRAALVVRVAPATFAALLAVMAAWAAVSLAEVPPLRDAIEGEQLDGWQVGLAAAGVALYAAAAAGYARLYRRRRQRVLLAVAFAFALLAEAMVVIAWARNWHVSWWEWHLLMVGAFAVVSLAARSEWHEERWSPLYLDETLAGARDVSILFADLEGYTPFAERTPPADVAAMLNAYFGRVVPLLESHGGDVRQLIGDAVMAVFNGRDELPDHARRAAEAGLALQRAADEVRDGRAGWPRFRVGVNSGEVLAGVVGAERGHRTHGVVGDTVNLAARLEGEASAGEVVVGGETARRLPPGTALERLPDRRVKGKAEPVEAYVVRSLPAAAGDAR